MSFEAVDFKNKHNTVNRKKTSRITPKAFLALILGALTAAGFSIVAIVASATSGNNPRPEPEHAASISLDDSLQMIDRAHELGELSAGRRHILRVKAVKNPELLPVEFRYSPDQVFTATRGCYTPVMVEAFQAMNTLKDSDRSELQELLLPPDDLEYYIQVDHPFPFRVNYRYPEDETLAKVAAEAVLVSYQTQVNEWGFWRPIIETEAEYYRFFLVELSGGLGGYLSPYAFNPDTPHTDAFSYIVLNTRVGYSGMLSLVAHEFNHACQVSMDALELVAFMENTASFVETRINYMSWIGKMYMIHVFQRNAHRPLEYMRYGGSDGYEYGGMFWASFLTHMYGDSDMAWLRMVWEGTVQEVMYNDPHYFDVIDEMLAERGGFSEMVKKFGRYRFFAGRDDDGQHMEGTYRLWDSEVGKIRELKTADLPIHEKTPEQEFLPMPNGCNYITLDVDDASDFPVRFRFDGEQDVSWYVTVMKIAHGLDTTHHDMELDEESRGDLVMESRVMDRMVMVVCHLAPEGYNPNDSAWDPAHYTFSIDRVLPAPHIERVDPAYIVRGEQSQLLNLHGSGFADSTEIAIDFSGDLVSGAITQFLSERHIVIIGTASINAEKGYRDLIVTSPGGESTVVEKAIKIVDADEVPEEKVFEEGSRAGGCNCGYGGPFGPGSGSIPGFFVFLLLLFGYTKLRHKENSK